MKVLHTSDWHLGKSLFGEKRYDEHEKFLDWLIGIINDEKIDLLIVSGDVFDTVTPSNRATELYYSFLYRTKNTSCRNVIITGGNHDSPSFLAAPMELLKHLDIHVVPDISNEDSEIIEIRNGYSKPELIVCAVPYLKDRDVRISNPGESSGDKESNLLEGIRCHYSAIHEKARVLKEKHKVPVISTGHLFTKNGITIKDDGVRNLYIGSLAAVDGSIFPDFIDYAALGHLHVPQTVKGKENIRYSGSPIPMGFNEIHQQKKVIVAEFGDSLKSIKEISVPLFRKLISVKGDREEIFRQIEEIKNAGDNELDVWVELLAKGFESTASLYDAAREIGENKKFKILKMSNIDERVTVISPLEESETLELLEPVDVFDRLLQEKNVGEDHRDGLKSAFEALVGEIEHEDKNKE